MNATDTEPTVEDRLAAVVYQAWTGQVTVKSDFARLHAAEIAACASEGYLTSKVGNGLYVAQWLPTPVGLEFLQDQRGEIIF